MSKIQPIRALERHLHELMRERAGSQIEEAQLVLPALTAPLPRSRSRAWLPIPGMMGGFSYWVEGRGLNVRLVAESWSRVVDGSGQRHLITVDGIRLVDQGFV
jgi:hypothetical protein